MTKADLAATVDELIELTPARRRKALAKLDNDTLVAVLGATAEDLEATQARLDQGYALRLAIFQAGRDRPVKVTQRAMGDAARVSEPAVIQALKKARLAAAG